MSATPEYDVVVVGSGYGGAVAAYRMAEAAVHEGETPAFSVCLLERGTEIRPGGYPSTPLSALRQIQADTPRGHIGRRTALFDAMSNRELREEYKHWGGVVGYRAYNRFEAGQTRYFSHRLRKPL